ncbi:MAG: LemA family protein [Capsulimonadaceae bacterium]|nr:LemA family protein [Capsulimonadaceae bacterium]
MTHGAILLTIGCVVVLGGYWLAAVWLTMRELVERARNEWQAILESVDQRDTVFSRLCEESRTLFQHDPIIARYIADYDTANPASETPTQRLRDTIERSAAAHGIIAQIHTYPSLFHSPEIIAISVELDEIDARIKTNAQLYDHSASTFNARRHDFAASMMARFWTDTDLPAIGTLPLNEVRALRIDEAVLTV